MRSGSLCSMRLATLHIHLSCGHTGLAPYVGLWEVHLDDQQASLSSDEDVIVEKMGWQLENFRTASVESLGLSPRANPQGEHQIE